MGGEAQTNIDLAGIKSDSGSSNNTYTGNAIFATYDLPLKLSGVREVVTGGFYSQMIASVETQVFYYAYGTASISASTTVTVTNRMAKTPTVVFATTQVNACGAVSVGTITATSFIITVASSCTATVSWMEQV